MRRLAAIFTILLLVIPMSGQETSSHKERKARLDKEIKILEQQIRDNSARSSNALNRLKLLQKKEETRRALINESDMQISSINDSIRMYRKEANMLQARLDTMTLYYNRLIRNAYKNRDSRVWYMYILAGENIGQAIKRFGYLRSLSGQMNVQGKKIQETKAELDAKLATLRDIKVRAEKVRSERQTELDKLVSEQKQSKNLVNKLGREKSKYQKQLASKKKQVEALNREIERIIAESMKGTSKKGSSAKKSAPINYTLAKEFQSNKGKLPWPATGPVTDKFGKHQHPVFKSITMPFNNGIGINVEKGSTAKAVFEGEVKRIIVMPGYNKCVLVQHGDYFTFYCKLESVSVKAGDKMKTGQTVGVIDTIDGQTQLHFELWKGTTPQNPESWLRPKD